VEAPQPRRGVKHRPQPKHGREPIPVPAGQVIYDSLKTSFVDFPRLITTLEKEGYSVISGCKGSEVVAFDTNNGVEKWRAFRWHTLEIDGLSDYHITCGQGGNYYSSAGAGSATLTE